VNSGEELAAKLRRITDALKAQKQAQDVVKQEQTPPVSDDLADFNSGFEDEGRSDNGPDDHRPTDNEDQTTKLMDEPQRQPEAERLRGATPGREIRPAVEASTPRNPPSDLVHRGSPLTQERLEQWLTERVDRTREEVLNALDRLQSEAMSYLEPAVQGARSEQFDRAEQQARSRTRWIGLVGWCKGRMRNNHAESRRTGANRQVEDQIAKSCRYSVITASCDERQPQWKYVNSIFTLASQISSSYVFHDNPCFFLQVPHWYVPFQVSIPIWQCPLISGATA